MSWRKYLKSKKGRRFSTAVFDCTFISNGTYGIYDNSKNLQACLRNYSLLNEAANYYCVTPGTPIRKLRLGKRPCKKVAGAQIDNLSEKEKC